MCGGSRGENQAIRYVCMHVWCVYVCPAHVRGKTCGGGKLSQIGYVSMHVWCVYGRLEKRNVWWNWRGKSGDYVCIYVCMYV
jgi:hypothetical protein